MGIIIRVLIDVCWGFGPRDGVGRDGMGNAGMMGLGGYGFKGWKGAGVVAGAGVGASVCIGVGRSNWTGCFSWSDGMCFATAVFGFSLYNTYYVPTVIVSRLYA